MRTPKTCLMIPVSLLLFLLSGCSMVDWYRDYDICQPCEKGFYSFQCDSGSFNLDLGGLTTFRMVGPPIIPLFPIPMGDPKHIIGDFSPDTLDVVFLGKYFGHALPTVRFIATRRTSYQWIMNPANG